MADLYEFNEATGLLLPAGAQTQFGYNAIVDKGRRQPPKTRLKPEFIQLGTRDREKLDATVQDLPRNFELAAWMIRLHVEFVSQFDVYANTGDEALDQVIEDLFDWHGRREVFDVARRHSRPEAMRLFEIAKLFSGDCAFLKVKGGSTQAIPGRRIAKPTSPQSKGSKKWKEAEKRVNDRGLVVDPKTGRILQASLCRWSDDGRTLIFDRLEDWDSLLYDGYFTDFDQDRGVSPMASAVNRMTDCMESLEWTNLKIKLHALFGIKFTRGGPDAVWEPPNDTDLKPATDTGQAGKVVDIQKGIMTFDLDPGEDVDTIESKTPASEFVDYTGLSIRIGLLALDIPYSMFDGQRSSYTSALADAMRYEFMAQAKQQKNREVMKAYSDWKLREWSASRSQMFEEFQRLVKASGLSDIALRRAVSWAGRETPWVDHQRQVKAYESEVALGINSRTRILKKRGGQRFRDISKELGHEEKRAVADGATLAVGKPGQTTNAPTGADTP